MLQRPLHRQGSSCFNPRPPRGGRLGLSPGRDREVRMSFNPRPPRGGRPERRMPVPRHEETFQSAPPARGATQGPRSRSTDHRSFNPRPPRGGRLAGALKNDERGFNPRPPRGGRPVATVVNRRVQHVSIRAPRAGGDSNATFQRGGSSSPGTIVSIRAPRAGGDRRGSSCDPTTAWASFNPRPPRGGRPTPDFRVPRDDRLHGSIRFNPRPPRGGRRDGAVERHSVPCFNPRPPRGGRQGSLRMSQPA